jgi:hypothetical protein
MLDLGQSALRQKSYRLHAILNYSFIANFNRNRSSDCRHNKIIHPTSQSLTRRFRAATQEIMFKETSQSLTTRCFRAATQELRQHT